MQSLLRRFTKRELLNDVTPLQMVRFDVTDKQSRVHLSAVDIGIGAEAVIKVLWKESCMIRVQSGVCVRVSFLWKLLGLSSHWVSWQKRRRERRPFT